MPPPPRQPAATPLGVGDVAAAYRQRFAEPPELVVRAPGRATLLGAHVDTSQGWVLAVAIERAIWVAAGRRPDRQLELAASDLGEEASLDLDRLPPPVPRRSPAESRWSDYAAGIAWALGERGLAPAGLRAAIRGDLPMAAGLSSSAALESALLLAWEALSELRLSPLERARTGYRAETGYLGLESGIMDQFVILHARRNGAVFLDCRSLAHQTLPLPAGVRLVIAESGVTRRLVGSEFNQRRRQCRRAVELLRRELPGICALRDVRPEQLARLAGLLPAEVRRRARHVVEECARARQGAAALRAGSLAEVGRLMRLSHQSSRDLYESSLPELDTLAAAAWETPGCYGARFSGGGFGGCVVALVEGRAVEAVGEAMERAFERRFGRLPALFTSGAAGAAGVLRGGAPRR